MDTAQKKRTPPGHIERQVKLEAETLELRIDPNSPLVSPELVWIPLIRAAVADAWPRADTALESRLVREVGLDQTCALAAAALMADLSRGSSTLPRFLATLSRMFQTELAMRRMPRGKVVDTRRVLTELERESVSRVAHFLGQRAIEATGAVRRYFSVYLNTQQLIPNEALISQLRASLQGRFPPRFLYLPMMCEPHPWTGNTGGGYLTKRLGARPLLDPRSAEQTNKFAGERPAGVLEAVNFAQDAARYRVRSQLLRHAIRALERNLQWPGIPRVGAAEDLGAGAVGDKAKFHRAMQYKQNNIAADRSVALLRIVRSAMAVEESDQLWFPVHLDFRGRIYARAHPFSYQGEDLSRALLALPTKRKLTEETRPIVLAEGARFYTGRRCHSEEAQEWFDSNKTAIEACARDPGDALDWLRGAAKPWSTIAFCQAITDPEGSDLPCTVDASASALQMLSILLEDGGLARIVNLTGEYDYAFDPYQHISTTCTWVLSQIQSVSTDLLLSFFKDSLPRSLVKAVAMPRVYGLTMLGVDDIVRDWFDEFLREKRIELPWDPQFYQSRVRRVAQALWLGVNRALPAMRRFHTWTQEVARLGRQEKRTIRWRMPDGFEVHHVPSESRIDKILLRSRGTALEMREAERQDAAQVKRALAANILQSMESFVLRDALRRMKRVGVPLVSATHDGYAFDPADRATVTACAAEAYEALYDARMLGCLLRDWRCIGVSLPTPPLVGTFSRAALSKAQFILS